MEDFASSAHKLDVRGTLTTGAVFGIFLTIGQSWSTAIRSVSLEAFGLKQGSDGTAVSDVIAGGVVTAVSLGLLFLIVWGNRCFEKGKGKRRLRRLRREAPPSTTAPVPPPPPSRQTLRSVV